MLNTELVSTLVSCKWLNDNIHLEELIILDASVKSKDCTLEDIIPNSRCIDVKGKFSDIDAQFPNTIPSQEQFQIQARLLGINQDSIVVVYDDKGIYWSPRIWWLFKVFGFKNIAVLDGGLPEWKKLGYETTSVSNASKSESGNFSAVYDTSKMYFFENISEISKDTNALILDARSEDRFNCNIPEPRASLRSGTIPNSKNLPYTKLLNGDCLKSKPELEVIFNTFKIEDKSVTFSCGSGITACILALAAEVSGHNQIAVYDGSWTEYGTLKKE